MKKLSLFFVLFALTSFACSFSSIQDSLGMGCGNKPFPDGVLFQDDFSAGAGCWDVADGDSGVTGYADGQYRIAVNNVQYDIWGNPGLSFDEGVRIEVDAFKSSGPETGDYGIICRYQDDRNFYQFMATADGFYGILVVLNGEQTVLGNSDLMDTDSINQGGAVNHLRADCIGDALTFYINGTLVAEVTDSTFTKGDVGLFAGTFDEAGMVVLFDNFKVLQP